MSFSYSPQAYTAESIDLNLTGREAALSSRALPSPQGINVF